LAGESLSVDAERSEQAVDVHDVERRGLGAGGWGLGAGEDVGFEKRDAVEAPGGVGEFVHKLGFGGSLRIVFGEELAAVLLVSGRIFGGEDGGAGRESVSEGVARRTLFAGIGARSGGVLRVRAIADGDARGLGGCRWGH
jgi:hypothetical protein